MYRFGKNIILLGLVLTIFSGCHNKISKLADDKKINSKDSLSVLITPFDTSKNSIGQKTNINNNDFIVLLFTSQDWHGGIKGSGGGTNYEIIAISKQSSAILIIDQLWIGQKNYEITVSKKFPAVAADGFSTNDTIFIRANDYRKDPDFKNNTEVADSEKRKSAPIEVSIDPPFTYQGAALIGYKLNGLRSYKTLDKIIKKPPLFYP